MDDVELDGHGRVSRPPCCSSSTSATRRPTSATFRGDELVEHWRFATVRDVDRRRARRRAAQPARAARHRPRDLTASIVSSTVPAARPEWMAMAERYLGHEMLVVGPGLRDRHADPHTTTRASSAPTGSSTRSPPTTASAARASCVDFGTAITFDVVSRGRRVPRRHHRPGRRDLARGADRARRRAAADRPRRAARADRQVHGRRDPLRRRLRLRRPGRRIVAPPARRARGGDARRSPPAAWPRTSCRSPTTIDEVDDLLTLTGPALAPRAQRQPLTCRARAHRPLDPRRHHDPQPRPARPAGRHRQLVRAPAGQALRRRAWRSREMVSSFAIHYGNEKTLTELLRIHPRRADGRAGRRSSSSARTRSHALRRRDGRRSAAPT